MATVSFSQEVYFVGENENMLNVSVVCSGKTTAKSLAVVLVASGSKKGSATGMLFLLRKLPVYCMVCLCMA